MRENINFNDFSKWLQCKSENLRGSENFPYPLSIIRPYPNVFLVCVGCAGDDGLY